MTKNLPNRMLSRSSVNLVWAMYISLANYIAFSIIVFHFDSIYVDMVHYLSYYLICSFTISYLELYDNVLHVVYPLKVFNRIQKKEYAEIETVRSINYMHVYDYPRIQLIFRGKRKCDWPSCTFQVYSLSRRKKILKILNSKGINIIVKSNNPKEFEILS